MTKQASPKYAPEAGERAVRMAFEHEGSSPCRGGDQLDRGEDRL
jgi:hypothetical protein